MELLIFGGIFFLFGYYAGNRRFRHSLNKATMVAWNKVSSREE